MLNNHPNNPDSLLLFTKHQQSIDIWRVPTLASLRPWGVSNFETGTSGNLRMLGATWSNMSSVQNPMDVNSPLKSNEPDYINIYLCIYILYKYICKMYIRPSYLPWEWDVSSCWISHDFTKWIKGWKPPPGPARDRDRWRKFTPWRPNWRRSWEPKPTLRTWWEWMAIEPLKIRVDWWL